MYAEIPAIATKALEFGTVLNTKNGLALAWKMIYVSWNARLINAKRSVTESNE